jgi:hypothetical protein
MKHNKVRQLSREQLHRKTPHFSEVPAAKTKNCLSHPGFRTLSLGKLKPIPICDKYVDSLHAISLDVAVKKKIKSETIKERRTFSLLSLSSIAILGTLKTSSR